MHGNKPGNKNPYAQAASAYGDHAQQHTPDQRELEARVLLKSAKMLKDLQSNWTEVNTDILEKTLKYNRQIWMMFYDTAVSDPKEGEEKRPNDLRSNIINLANFIFKHETDILADFDRKPEKLDILVNINREIAAGLMENAKTSEQEQESTNKPPQSEDSSS